MATWVKRRRRSSNMEMLRWYSEESIEKSPLHVSLSVAKQTGVFVTLEGSLEQTRAMRSTTKPFKEALRSAGLQDSV